MAQQRASVVPHVLLALALLSWAGNWVIGRGLRFDAPPVAITFWRWTIALVLLTPFTYTRLCAQREVVRCSWRIIVLLGMLATVCQHIPIYLGLRETTATNGALLNSSSPILIALLSRVMVGEKLRAQGIIGIAISVCGVLSIISRGDVDVLHELRFNAGDLWVLTATLAWAFYTVCLRWQPAGLDRLSFLTLLAAVGVLGCAPLYMLEIASGHVLRLNPASIFGIGYIGVVATVGGYICWNRGVERIGPSRAGQYMYLMLVFTPMLATLFLGEELHAYHFVGTALIVVGIYLTSVHGLARMANPPD